MDTVTNKFNQLWDDFVSSFKGNLIAQARKQTLSFAFVKLIFSEACLSWTSEYSVNGRWLDNLVKENPANGNLVKEILTQDMALKEIAVQGDSLDFLKYVAPVGAGAIGYGISKALHLATLGTACATLAPLLIAIPVTNGCLNSRKENATMRLIDGYVAQLSKYREAVVAALMAEA